MQRPIHWARQAIVSSQPPVKPRPKCNLAQQEQRHHHNNSHLRRNPSKKAVRQEPVRGMEPPLLLGSSRAPRRAPPEVGNHRREALGKLQRHRLTLRLRQHRRQGRGQQMERRRRPPEVRVLGATRT
ncbi:uncharacterized protein Tco025E_10079 [Trypanosoma conorhini]|uniref:Uncharacterized protein n=1 Tax=Trypanosoma conorhini TaxID=83891 RepID=A0A3R7KIS7_9TRYP|nr:uncharacterized protein Tco025E_10079 [Trypanosoma conorhini]RNE95293.1 hypothetical protein Tco025E_10079 [Trypanosoma conorhini]